MTDIRTDAFTELGHAVLNARHNGTPPERAEAARLTLLGHLPPLPPYVDAVFRTEFVEVPMVAISQGGKIVFIGIKTDGSKQVVGWDSVKEERTVLARIDAQTHVTHLHFPEGSESPAWAVMVGTPTRAINLFWGEWSNHFSFEEHSRTYLDPRMRTYELEHVLFFLNPQGGCSAIATLVRESGSKEVRHFCDAYDEDDDGTWLVDEGVIRVLGVFEGSRVAILMKKPGGEPCERVLLDSLWATSPSWMSGWYDRILEGSVMERDDEVSFVGFRKEGQDDDWIAADAYLVGRNGQTLIEEHVAPSALVCLPNSRILIEERSEKGKLRLRDTLPTDDTSNNEIVLENVQRIHGIVETRTGMAIHASYESGGRSILLVDWETDVVWGLTDGFFQSEDMRNLRRWGHHLVFQVGDRLQVVSVEEVELWLDETNSIIRNRSVAPVVTNSYPLYTPFDRLVPTDVGILSWHFVNGTFYVIRYSLD